MFRRLAEAFQDNSHAKYIDEQLAYHGSMDHMLLSGSSVSGLPSFDKVIETADPLRQDKVQERPLAYPSDIFRAVPNPGLAALASECMSNSLDRLIASKNPNDRVGCGWLYTPPPVNSPYPALSKGFLGKLDGPVKAFNPPSYKQWFFDLEAAKKQVLLDKCKALKTCEDLNNPVFKGDCGFCLHTNQGVPIDANGQPLYPTDPRGACDSEAIVRSRDQCPPPPPPPPGPAPIVDRTCDPVGGRLGAECIRRQVIAAGCNERGALALALAGSPPPNDYMANLRDSAAVKMYQRAAQPPLNLELFAQGRATTQKVLDEARQLVGQTSKPEASGLGLAARDLCLRRGAFERYDICSEIADTRTPPYDLSCLQRLFLKMGGNTSGSRYPTSKNHNFYNSFGTWGEVKQYLQKMYNDMYANTPSGPLKEGFEDKGSKYERQRQAMADLIGVNLEKAIERVPYRQGIEVFYFVLSPQWHAGKPPTVRGFLRRTVERDFVQLQPGPSRVAQIGGGGCGAMVQLTDVRAQEDASVKFQVNIDDGFWISVNQPHDRERKAMVEVNADEPGLFESNWYQGPTWYGSKSCTPFSASTPNIFKAFFQDAGCGWNSFLMNTSSCGGANPFQKPYYSLTLEERAPFLAWEVSPLNSQFEEKRLPALFGQWVDGNHIFGHTVFTRKDDRQTVPGKKGFIRMNNIRSLIDMYSIAFQSWKTLSFAVRFQSMPVKDTVVKIAPGRGYMSLVATPSGSSIAISVEHNFGGGGVKTLPFRSGFPLNKWYLFFVHNYGTGFDLYCNAVDETVISKGKSGGIGSLKVEHNGPMFQANETFFPQNGSGQPAGQCWLIWGAQRHRGMEGVYGTSAFEYDLAWIHFFDQFTSNEDIYRECMGDWKYTQFPVEYRKFETRVDV
jgi:hypothetical protein